MSEYKSDLIDPGLPFVNEYDDKYDKSSVDEVASAASAGDAAALYELAARYRLGVDGVDQDYVRAIELYKAVLRQQNNVSAFYHIGYMILDGAYGAERTIEALPYLYAAYSLGDPVAAVQLGIQYEYGEIVPQDLDKALEFYFFALEHGNEGACFNIGEVYRRRNDIPEAIKYYERARALDLYREDAEQMIAALTGKDTFSNTNTNTFPDPEYYVNQATELLNSGKYMDAFSVISEGFRYYNSDLRIIYKLIEIDDIVLLATYLSGHLSPDHENLCRMILDLIGTLRNNSFGDPAWIDKVESDVYFFLGDTFMQREQIETALDCFERVDVGHTPHAAYSIFLAHVHDVDKYIDCFRHDVDMFEKALLSSHWPNDTQKALAYLGLSALYANGFPGIPRDLQYGYECAQKSTALNPSVGGDELAKYSKSLFGKITYTP